MTMHVKSFQPSLIFVVKARREKPQTSVVSDILASRNPFVTCTHSPPLKSKIIKKTNNISDDQMPDLSSTKTRGLIVSNNVHEFCSHLRQQLKISFVLQTALAFYLTYSKDSTHSK